MSERLQEFKDSLGRYEEAMQDAPRAAAEEARQKVQTEAGRQWIRELNKARLASRDGTLPEQVFSTEDAEICRVFLDHMRQRDFPASTLLENKIEYDGAAVLWGRLRRWMGKDRVEPFAIRGYQVGIADSQPAFLCEDGLIRAYTSSYLPSRSDGIDRQYQIGNLPLDSNTGQLSEVLTWRSDENRDYGSECRDYDKEYYSLDRMLHGALINAEQEALKAASSK